MSAKRQLESESEDENRISLVIDEEDFVPATVVSKSKYTTEEHKPTTYTLKRFKAFTTTKNKLGKDVIVPMCPHGIRMTTNSSFYICANKEGRCGFQILIASFKAMVEKGMIRGLDQDPENFPKKFVMPWCDSCDVMTMMMNIKEPDWSSYMLPAFRCSPDCEHVHSLTVDKVKELDLTFVREVYEQFRRKKRGVKRFKKGAKAASDDESRKPVKPAFD